MANITAENDSAPEIPPLPTLLSLPADTLLTILSQLRPSDVLSLHSAAPQDSLLYDMAKDPTMWHSFFLADFGTTPPVPLFIEAGCINWKRAWEDRRKRERVLTMGREIGWRERRLYINPYRKLWNDKQKRQKCCAK